MPDKDDAPNNGAPDMDTARAERIRALKDQAGWTFQRLADELGVNKGTAESWVYRRVKPNYPHLARLAELFDVPVRWLESGEDGDAERADPLETIRYDLDRLRGHVLRLEEAIRFVHDNTDRITRLEGAHDELADLVERQAAALMPLATSLMQAAADRRASAGQSPVSGERRRSTGRRRTDPAAD